MSGPRFPFRLRLILLLPLCLAASCATRPVLTAAARSELWQQHQLALAALDKWEARGRVAVRVENKGWTAGLRWQQQGGSYSARVTGPLGRGLYELSNNGGNVQLRMQDNRLLYASDAESLMQQNLGWSIPVSGFIYWIRGLPAPDSRPADMTLDEDGRLQTLNQDGWQISYDGYLPRGHYELPQKITLTRDDFMLRLIIHDWEV
jgi:outer membrane lipoprotein LolB